MRGSERASGASAEGAKAETNGPIDAIICV